MLRKRVEVLEAEVAGLEVVPFWVLGWGAEAEVLEPEALRAEARALVALYGGREERAGGEQRRER